MCELRNLFIVSVGMHYTGHSVRFIYEAKLPIYYQGSSTHVGFITERRLFNKRFINGRQINTLDGGHY